MLPPRRSAANGGESDDSPHSALFAAPCLERRRAINDLDGVCIDTVLRRIVLSLAACWRMRQRISTAGRRHLSGGKSPMRTVFTRLFVATSLSLVVAATAVAAEAPKMPRTKDGKPDLNGIWQALNTANYDLEPHAARAALAHGARASSCPCPRRKSWRSARSARCPPASASSKATRFRTSPRRSRRRRRTRRTGSTLRSGGQVLSARRAARDLHAVPVPDLPEQGLRCSSRTSTPARSATSI